MASVLGLLFGDMILAAEIVDAAPWWDVAGGKTAVLDVAWFRLWIND